MSESASRQLELAAAIATLAAAGARFFCVLPEEGDSLGLADAGRRIGVSSDWIRSHLSEFPNAWRLPAGERRTATGEGRNVGELRIPVADLNAFQQRQRLQKGATS